MADIINWQKTPRQILQTGPVIPVIVIKDVEQAVPLAHALLQGGIKVMEITLRSKAAIEAIHRISREVPETVVGAGTVTSAADLEAVREAGAVFAVSPGLTPALLTAGVRGSIALLPGISTASELMLGMEMGYTAFKFFPAEAAGGIRMLQAIAGPFPHITFCPTGGISAANYQKYLALGNVACVGGSWLVPAAVLEERDWRKVTDLTREAVNGI